VPCNLPGLMHPRAFSVPFQAIHTAVGQCSQPSRKLNQVEHGKTQEARVCRCLSFLEILFYFLRQSRWTKNTKELSAVFDSPTEHALLILQANIAYQHRNHGRGSSNPPRVP
jgi:hypothetical protein